MLYSLSLSLSPSLLKIKTIKKICASTGAFTPIFAVLTTELVQTNVLWLAGQFLGDFFKAHNDGKYMRPDGSQASFITIQLYLNEGMQGGNTTFLSDDDDAEKAVGVEPRVGRVLVFQHNIRHEGSLLSAGIKYTMRTDIMYRLTAPPPSQKGDQGSHPVGDDDDDGSSSSSKRNCQIM